MLPAALVALRDAHASPPATVVDLQPFREVTSIKVASRDGREGSATLINLNPRINTWFLLTVTWKGDKGGKTYHLESRDRKQDIRLDPAFPYGLSIRASGARLQCDLWSGDAGVPGIDEARASRDVYAPLCEGRLFLRNPTQGHKTTREWATDFLRRHVPGGEKVIALAHETIYKDAFVSTAETTPAERGAAARRTKLKGSPAPALVSPRHADTYLVPADLGIDLEYEEPGKMLAGRWYRARNLAGVFVSALKPSQVSESVIEAEKGRVKPLDEVEEEALVYMVAFDLSQFDLGFEMGTEHPKVGWSERVPPEVRDDALAGPDGIGTVEPLVMTGLVNPIDAERVMATFIGGFKRYHGGFKRGELAHRNRGSHYGFVEYGVVLSRLQPGLATAIIYEDGGVELKTWGEDDGAELAQVRHARQNGAPIVEFDAATGTSRPGALVAAPALGNWSGSVEGRFRTLRAGLGLHEAKGERFLIYGYFSAATPSAMARVFQAYGCRYAMILDINALEHTYLAVYRRESGRLLPEHLVKGMSVLDKVSEGEVIPRFVGYADNRDFFCVLEREER